MCQACDEVKAILQECANRQGHNKCWWNPEVLNSLMAVYGIQSTVEPNLPPKHEFQLGCKVYMDDLYRGVVDIKGENNGNRSGCIENG